MIRYGGSGQGSSKHIRFFKRLSKSKCLINTDEHLIEKIAVFRHAGGRFSFIYVEVQAEPPTELNSNTKWRIEEGLETSGYASESYALLGKRPIKMSEYDDGFAEIKGKIVHASKARTVFGI